MFINWIAATMGTYGLGFNSVNLGGDIYVSFVLTAFIEIPSYIFLVLVVDRMGRKPVLIFCQVGQTPTGKLILVPRGCVILLR